MAKKNKNTITYIPRENKKTGEVTLYKITYNEEQVLKLANKVCVCCGYPMYFERKIEHPVTRKKYDWMISKHIISNTDYATDLHTGKTTIYDTVYGYKYSCPELADSLYSLSEFDDIDHLGTKEHYEVSIYKLIDAINENIAYPARKELISEAKEYLKGIKKDYDINRNPNESFKVLYFGLKTLFDLKLGEMCDQNTYVEQAKDIISIESKTYSKETIEDVETILRLTSRRYDRF